MAAFTSKDLFAGLCGFGLGTQMAGGKVLWAANHWPLAVQYGSLNHPCTEYVCQDLSQADWRDTPDTDLATGAPAARVISQTTAARSATTRAGARPGP